MKLTDYGKWVETTGQGQLPHFKKGNIFNVKALGIMQITQELLKNGERYKLFAKSGTIWFYSRFFKDFIVSYYPRSKTGGSFFEYEFSRRGLIFTKLIKYPHIECRLRHEFSNVVITKTMEKHEFRKALKQQIEKSK